MLNVIENLKLIVFYANANNEILLGEIKDFKIKIYISSFKKTPAKILGQISLCHKMTVYKRIRRFI